ncbi:hypothetical protein Enr10x_31990 [Gimesia panareensis]|uniref:Uncharacterized protein n=1 Tax=Gimesia panareensis TaxID=2527978 RepID=A0A517Q8C8_9PLAN|nr:hypothetical protein Enr10x_31990 [Gimesia panareensis]
MLITETEGPGNLQNVCCFIGNSLSVSPQKHTNSSIVFFQLCGQVAYVAFSPDVLAVACYD